MIKNEKRKEFKREIILYLLFGILTTVVASVTNFGLLWGCQAIFHVATDPGESGYVAIFTVAKIFSWLCAVLFAFFTNRKFVFRDEEKTVAIQLAKFASGRVATLFLDHLVNLGLLALLGKFSFAAIDGFLGIAADKYREVIAWVVTQVFVVVCNYFISKFFVFGTKKEKAKKI